MPNDDPFATPQEVVEDAPPPEVEVPPTPQPEMASPVMEQLASTLGNMQAAIDNLNARIEAASRPAPEEPSLPPTADEFTQQLYSAPQEAVRSEIQRATAPVVSQLAEQVAESNLNEMRNRIDQEWGAGAFDKTIEPQIRPIINEALRLNPQGLLNRRALMDAVDTYVGKNVSALISHRDEYKGSKEKQEVDAAAKLRDAILTDIQPNLSGGIRRSGSAPAALTEEQKQIAREMFKADGVRRDERKLAAIQSGNVRTLEDYMRVNEQLKKETK